jgi:hypothetical protein
MNWLNIFMKVPKENPEPEIMVLVHSVDGSQKWITVYRTKIINKIRFAELGRSSGWFILNDDGTTDNPCYIKWIGNI